MGSVRLLIDSSGNVKKSYTFDPFGNLLENYDDGGNIENSYLFTGQFFDNQINQYYLRARQYDPAIQRFTSIDPVRGGFKVPLTLHQYLYCLNDPVNRWYPDGKFSLMEHKVAITVGAIIAAITYKILTHPCYQGLSNSKITDADLLNQIRRIRAGTEAVQYAKNQNPTTWNKFEELYQQQGARQVGEYGVGVVGEGETLSEGEQQVIKLFETNVWNWQNPEANEHELLFYMPGDEEGYVQRWADAEIKRGGIIEGQLIGEAERRGLEIR